jgi:phosphatidylinositol phospholipase C, beta
MHSAKGIASSTDHGNDSQNDSFGASSNSMFTHQQSIDQQRTVDQMRLQQQHIQQQQEHRLQQIDHQNEARDIVAEPLDKILENKLVREKREAMEKKLKSLKKNHDKEKMKAITQKCGDVSDKKSKFYMGNKLVKRLSSKNMYVFLLLSFISFILFTRCFFFRDMNVQLPPCPTEPGEAGGQEERLFQICREHAGMYKEIFEKYHETVYVIAADILQKSQERQVKQLKVRKIRTVRRKKKSYYFN